TALPKWWPTISDGPFCPSTWAPTTPTTSRCNRYSAPRWPCPSCRCACCGDKAGNPHPPSNGCRPAIWNCWGKCSRRNRPLPRFRRPARLVRNYAHQPAVRRLATDGRADLVTYAVPFGQRLGGPLIGDQKIEFELSPATYPGDAGAMRGESVTLHGSTGDFVDM